MTDAAAGWVGEATASSTRRYWGRPVREYGWPLELARLKRDPVWRGEGVPAGQGRPVFLIPGFMAGDSSLRTMATWLRHSGYRVRHSGIRWNVACTDRTLLAVEERLARFSASAGAPVTIVGHSRGGLLAHAIAERRPDLVARVIALGSPLVDPFDIGLLTHAAVAYAKRLEWVRNPVSRQRGCFTRDCDCALARAASQQDGEAVVPVVSVVTQDDGVVNPAACLLPGARVVHVRGSHIGLAFNAQVYRVLAEELARDA